MKRAALMAIVVLSAGFAAGCERNDSTSSYDPKLDGVSPPAFKRPDESILENQKEILAKTGGGTSNVTVPSTPAATTVAPATSTGVEAPSTPASDKAAPATPSGGDMTPPPPG